VGDICQQLAPLLIGCLFGFFFHLCSSGSSFYWRVMALLLWVLSIFKGEHMTIILELYLCVLQWRLRVPIPLDPGLLNLHDAAAATQLIQQ
jgi:hypothetical protein